MRTKLTSVISLLMATVLVLGTLFTSCTPKKKELQVVEYLDKIFEATFAGLEGSAPQVTTSKVTFKNTPDLGIPHFVDATMTLISGTSGEAVSKAEITLDSGKLDYSVYSSGLTYIVGSSAIGPNMYGFELTDISKLSDLFGSMVAPEYPESGELDGGSSASDLMGSLSGINSLLDGSNPEKVYSLLEKYAKLISDAAEGACKSSIKTGNEITVTVEFNTDSAKKLVKDVFTSLKKDKDLKSIIESALVTSGMTNAEAKEQINLFFSDEMLRSIYDALDAVPFSLKTIVKADKNYILNGITVELAAQGTTFKMFFDSSEEGKIELGYSNSATIEGEFTKQENKLVFENKTVDGAEIFEVNAITIINNRAYAERLLKSEVKDGKYTVTVRMIDEIEGSWDMTLAGTVASEGNKSTFTLASLTAYGETVNVDLTVETEIGGTLPAFPTNFKNILDVSADEFKVIEGYLKDSALGQYMTDSDSEIVLPDVEY